MKQNKIALTFLLISFINGFAFSQLPVSKQATLVETVSSSEVMIEATGIYKGKGKSDRKKKKDVEKKGMSGAAMDAKKSAVYFVLFGGTDPLLSTVDEQQKFGAHEGFFFNKDNVSNYITYEDTQVIKKLKTDGVKV